MNAAGMLGRDTVISCGTFVVGLILLWLLVERLHMPKVPATSLSFVIATTLHYAFGRMWIFRGTDRAMGAGYVYFLVNAGIGMVLTTSLFAAALELAPVNYLVARAVVSLIAGLVMFLLNAMLNFRRL